MNKFISSSIMSGKLENITGLNTSPLVNHFCLNICGIRNICYSQNMLKTFRKSSNPSFKLNGKNLSQKLLTVEEIQSIKFPRNTVRFNAHGELLNYTHLLNLVRIAKYYEDTAKYKSNFPLKVFTLWTKRNELIQLLEDNIKASKVKMPSNMYFIYSSMYIDNRTNKNTLSKLFNKVFTVYNSKYALSKNIKINCTGKKCVECMLCYTDNKVTYINEVEKKQQPVFIKTKEERSTKKHSLSNYNLIGVK